MGIGQGPESIPFLSPASTYVTNIGMGVGRGLGYGDGVESDRSARCVSRYYPPSFECGPAKLVSGRHGDGDRRQT